jgi:hypothetical protein
LDRFTEGTMKVDTNGFAWALGFEHLVCRLVVPLIDVLCTCCRTVAFAVSTSCVVHFAGTALLCRFRHLSRLVAQQLRLEGHACETRHFDILKTQINLPPTMLFASVPSICRVGSSKYLMISFDFVELQSHDSLRLPRGHCRGLWNCRSNGTIKYQQRAVICLPL